MPYTVTKMLHIKPYFPPKGKGVCGFAAHEEDQSIALRKLEDGGIVGAAHGEVEAAAVKLGVMRS